MLKKDQLKGFAVGVLVTMLVLSFSTNGFAASISKNISVLYNNIQLVVEGSKVNLGKDAAGNSIEPFIYNGTTYLPVRAVGEALGKSVTWDGNTQTVFIGAQPNVKTDMTQVIEPYKVDGIKVYKSNTSNSFSMAGVNYGSGYTMGGFSTSYMIFNLNVKIGDKILLKIG